MCGGWMSWHCRHTNISTPTTGHYLDDDDNIISIQGRLCSFFISLMMSEKDCLANLDFWISGRNFVPQNFPNIRYPKLSINECLAIVGQTIESIFLLIDISPLWQTLPYNFYIKFQNTTTARYKKCKTLKKSLKKTVQTP